MIINNNNLREQLIIIGSDRIQSAEIIYAIYVALKDKSLRPDLLLSEVVPYFNKYEYLLLTAFALRANANPNLYIQSNYGTVHILGYAYILHGEDTTYKVGSARPLDIHIGLLLFKESKPNMDMFLSPVNVRREFETTQKVSVIQWLEQNNIPNILKKETTDLQELHRIHMLLNITNKEKLEKENYIESDGKVCMRYYSNFALEDCPKTKDMLEMDYILLHIAFSFFNVDGYKKMIDEGYYPSYLLVNSMIVEAVKYKDRSYVPHSNAIIENGTQLDTEQLNLISSGLGPDVYQRITKEYLQPYWKKICSVTKDVGKSPLKLKRLAQSFNIDPEGNKEIICTSLDNISKSDKQTVIENSMKRQSIKLNSHVTSIADYSISDDFVCQNRSTMKHEANEYNDLDISTYKDMNGSNWCFTSDVYDDLLEYKINPYTKENLKDSFLSIVN
jgi:hypothetical protein